MEQDEKIQIELMTPLTADFLPDEREDDDWGYDGQTGYPLDGADLVQYQDAIQEMADRENSIGAENGEPCNLMQYFSGNPAISEKVMSAVVSVKESDGVLYGCTTLRMKDYLEADELKELCGYITGQYSDGWGEGFEQRDIRVDGGILNVHFWQPHDSFRFQEAPVQDNQTAGKSVKRPRLKLLGHDGNIFSILADARRLLRANGQDREADAMTQRVHNSGDYYSALHIISEYVETELSQDAGTQSRKNGEKKKGKTTGEKGR
jgi:hypothetical protein